MRTTALTTSALLLLGLMGCNPDNNGNGNNPDDGRVQGRITDAGGSQYARLAGDGSIATAATARALAVGPNGSATALASTEIQADGTYSFDLEPDQRDVVIEAVDASGSVVGSVILEHTGSEGQPVICSPINTETSVESRVFTAMREMGDADANPIDVRGRIDAAAATEIASMTESEGDAVLLAMGEAIAAAQQAEVDAYAASGFETSQDALFDAEAVAMSGLNIGLDTAAQGVGDASEVYAAFFAEADAAINDLGATAEEQADAERNASSAMRLTFEARTGAEANPVVEAAALTAARHEARLTGKAINAVLLAADAGVATQDEADAAIAALRTDVETAGSLASCAQAYGDFSANVIGTGDVESSVLGTYLDLDLASAVLVQGVVDSAVASGATLDTALQDGVDLALDSGFDADAISTVVVTAHGAHRAQIDSAVTSTLDLWTDTELDTATRLMVLTTGGFSGS